MMISKKHGSIRGRALVCVVVSLCLVSMSVDGRAGSITIENALLTIGDEAFKRKDFVAASEAYDKALRAEPKSPDALAGLAFSLLALERPDEAVPVANRLLEVELSTARSYVLRGRINYALQHFDRADRAVEEGLGLHPASWALHALKADLRLAREDFEGAVRSFEAAAKLTPTIFDDGQRLTLRESVVRDFLTVRNLPKPPNVKRARVKNDPSPAYTGLAQHRHTEGTLRLLIRINEAGAIDRVVPLTSLPHGLTVKAVEAAFKLECEPAETGGEPMATYLRVSINFSIGGRGRH